MNSASANSILFSRFMMWEESHASSTKRFPDPLPKGDIILFSIGASMPEMPVAGEDHGDSCSIGGGDDFLVAHGTAGLDAGGNTGIDGRLQTIGEGEHGIGGDDGAFQIKAGFLGFPDGDA